MKLIVEWVNPDREPDKDTGSLTDAASFEGDKVEFITEPSGALVVFEAPAKPWAAFGPGVWSRIYRV